MFRPSMKLGALLLGLAAAAPVQAAAQRIDPTRIIDMHVNAESENRAFDGSVLEGQRFRISFRGQGSYELLPVLVDAQAGRFRVTVFAGPEGAEGAQLRQTGIVDARQGVPVALPGMPSVSLVIEGVRRAETTAAAPAAGAQLISNRQSAFVLRRSLQTECCVTCGNVRACGCRVVHDCDMCCVMPCCRPGDITAAPGIQAPGTFAQFAGQCGSPIKDEERIFTPRRGTTRIASSR